MGNLHKAVVVLLFAVLLYIYGMRVAELASMWDPPQLPDRIPESAIHVYQDRVEIEGTYLLARYKDTNSMLPVLDYGSNGLMVPLTDDIELKVGDIVSYRVPNVPGIIVHRIIAIEEDDKGTYYVLRGDNNPYSDPYKIRRENIERLTVGIVW